jgi:hypothetical protein
MWIFNFDYRLSRESIGFLLAGVDGVFSVYAACADAHRRSVQ